MRSIATAKDGSGPVKVPAPIIPTIHVLAVNYDRELDLPHLRVRRPIVHFLVPSERATVVARHGRSMPTVVQEA